MQQRLARWFLLSVLCLLFVPAYQAQDPNARLKKIERVGKGRNLGDQDKNDIKYLATEP